MRSQRQILFAGLLGLSACPPGGSTSETSATAGGPGGEASTSGGATSSEGTGSTGDGVTDGVTTSAGTATGGPGTTGDTGGPPPAGACPIDQFPEDRQFVFDSSGTPISSDTVWTKDNLYIITDELNVRALLTIAAGTTVCFGRDINSNGSMQVGGLDGGGIRVAGTADEHVTLTALDPDRGWTGIYVNGDVTEIDFAYTDFVHASELEIDSTFFSWGALRIRGVEDSTAPPARLHNVTFSGVKRGGALWLEGPAGLTPDSSIRIDAFDLDPDEEVGEADSAVLASLQAASTLAPGMITLSPEIPEMHRGIEPLSKVLSDHATLHALEVPYLAKRGIFVVSSSNAPNQSLTIEAGVEVRLGSANVIQAGTESLNQGDLIVAGTAEAPVRFVYYPFPNDFLDHWGGLFFLTYDPAVSRVSHAVLTDAGGSAVAEVNDACKDNSSGAIVLAATQLAEGWPGIAIDHTTIDGSLSHGVVAECLGGCIDPTVDYTDPALANVFLDIAGEQQILATCP